MERNRARDEQRNTLNPQSSAPLIDKQRAVSPTARAPESTSDLAQKTNSGAARDPLPLETRQEPPASAEQQAKTPLQLKQLKSGAVASADSVTSESNENSESPVLSRFGARFQRTAGEPALTRAASLPVNPAAAWRKQLEPVERALAKNQSLHTGLAYSLPILQL